MKIFIVTFFLFALSGCGSVATLAGSDEHISQTLRAKGSYCESLSRIYSGTIYDYCTLHTRPQTAPKSEFKVLYMSDMLFSATLDTLALPYSIYAQSKQGDIDLRHD